MNHRGRQKNLRGQLASCRLDAVLITHLPNIRYLCGFTGSAGLLLVGESGSVFFTDVRYATQSREEVEGAGVVIARKALVTALAERVAGMRKKSNQWRIGIEADHLTVAEKKRLQDLMPRGVQLRSAPPLVERARMVKDAAELERIRAAVLLGTTLFDRALEVIRPGVRENEVAAEMEYAARRAGAEKMSFPTIIASGARSALPHGRASSQAIANGGFVVCDFGVILDG
ncbi:MAG TPA: Xaa-Pro peptidase family protein, partial [Bryobacteraceae bacterium]|nr:Xaa-Pro peptidase family protein [Bryobacteraceae bacterium]